MVSPQRTSLLSPLSQHPGPPQTKGPLSNAQQSPLSLSLTLRHRSPTRDRRSFLDLLVGLWVARRSPPVFMLPRSTKCHDHPELWRDGRGPRQSRGSPSARKPATNPRPLQRSCSLSGHRFSGGTARTTSTPSPPPRSPFQRASRPRGFSHTQIHQIQSPSLQDPAIRAQVIVSLQSPVPKCGAQRTKTWARRPGTQSSPTRPNPRSLP
jgi:hypothetical protein